MKTPFYQLLSQLNLLAATRQSGPGLWLIVLPCRYPTKIPTAPVIKK